METKTTETKRKKGKPLTTEDLKSVKIEISHKTTLCGVSFMTSPESAGLELVGGSIVPGGIIQLGDSKITPEMELLGS